MLHEWGGGGERVEGARIRVRAAFLHFFLFYSTTCSNHLQPGLPPPSPACPGPRAGRDAAAAAATWRGQVGRGPAAAAEASARSWARPRGLGPWGAPCRAGRCPPVSQRPPGPCRAGGEAAQRGSGGSPGMPLASDRLQHRCCQCWAGMAVGSLG